MAYKVNVTVTGQPQRTGRHGVARNKSSIGIRERRNVLDQWEREGRPDCWIVAWLSYREAGWDVPEMAQPVSAAEWVALRRWAKNFAYRQMSGADGRSSRYTQLLDMDRDLVADTVAALDRPEEAADLWPHESPAPITRELRAEAIAALAPRLMEYGSLP